MQAAPHDAPPHLPEDFTGGELLSRSESAWVFRASRAVDGSPVVVRLDRATGDRAGAVEALSELAVLAAVEHPGIARLVAHGRVEGGARYVAREWIDGVDLLDWARDRSAVEVGQVLARLCPALEHLHRHGFAHADLKPENVIVTADGRPVLCDFGLSRPTGRDALGLGETSGTLFSLAPERLMGLPPTPASDLFAFGAMLHRLLVGAHRGARDFYAAFPERSFLDAAGTDPEELPPWSRDLVANLTARGPERRPRSAAQVGRILAERLELQLDDDDAEEAPRWPVAFGRDAWLAAWLRDLGTSGEEEVVQWVRSPAGEDPRPLYAHLRVYAALRGRASVGVDLARDLAKVETGVALDRWASALASDASGLIVLCVPELTPWIERALDSLVRASRLERGRAGGAAGIVCVGSLDPPDSRWVVRAVPPVDEVTTARFIDQAFPNEPAERRSALAARIEAGAEGSATKADRLLAGAARSGVFYADGGAFRVRPGDVARLLGSSGARGGDARDDVARLTEDQRRFLDALDVCGDGAAPDDVFALAGESAARSFVDLRDGGWIEMQRDAGDTRVQRLCAWNGPLVDEASRRRQHAQRAARIDENGGSPALACMHRYCADPSDANGTAFGTELRRLTDRAQSERALELIDRFVAIAGVSADVDEGSILAASITIERARAWCAVGRTDIAQRALDSIDDLEDDETASSVELMRGHIAARLHETDEAFEHFDRAEARHPSAIGDATFGRIELLHSLGRDAEVLTIVAAFDPRQRESAGDLPARKRAYVESLAAMSMFRVGRADEALELTRSLVREVEAEDDVGLEAALHINLSLIERSSGSLDAARSELERAIELYDRAGIVAGLAHARATLGGLLRELVELKAAEPLLLDALEMRARLGDREGMTTVRGMLGLLLFDRGHARSAIETLESTAAAMTGAQRRRFAPLLTAKAIEMRARIGDHERDADLPALAEEADPRILLAKARIAWLRDDAESALGFARRTESFARSLKLGRLAEEAARLGSRLRDEAPEQTSASDPTDAPSLGRLDEDVKRVLAPGAFDAARARELAEDLARRGRDDRAARLFLALATRANDDASARACTDRAEELLDVCTKGLTGGELASFRACLLGEPDPSPGDLARRSDVPTTEGDLAEEMASLLDINRQLLVQKDLSALLGVIVESALRVSGAERGFLVLEEHGDLRFDTALDSCRGDVAEPEFEVSASVIREALDRMEPIRVSNAVDDPLLGRRTSVVSLELRSILCTPFEIHDDLRGAIYLDHRLRKGAFGERATRLCALLADQAALAIKQMKRMQEIRSLNRELEKRVVEREADLRAARTELRERGGPAGATELVGDSRAMRDVRDLLRKAGPTGLPVLVTGQSGTGKELAVRSLHALSARSNGPFISESCAALPPSLIESELFGFKRGAFTGADRDHAGLFERADGGTLFLDEIGEMPLALQVKLLRVLETGEVRRLGDNEALAVDVRLVVATNRDLELEVAEQRFRADLFYRINGIQITMPSLAERAEDIPSLAEHFLQLEDPGRRVAKRVLTALSRRSWPGNVRELRNEVARLCVLSDDALDDPALVSAASTRVQHDPSGDGVVPIAELERRAILDALRRTGGDKRRAAELLGISRAKIYQRLKEWDELESD